MIKPQQGVKHVGVGQSVLISAGSIEVFKLLRLAVCGLTCVLQINLYMIRSYPISFFVFFTVCVPIGGGLVLSQGQVWGIFF